MGGARLFRSVLCAILLITISASFSGCSKKSDTESNIDDTAEVELTVWRASDDAESFESIISAYRQQHPNVTINYVYNPEWKRNPDQYLQESINALATGKGPDIWSVRNDWLPAQYEKVRPAPEGLFATYTNDDNLQSASNAQVVEALFVPAVTEDTIFGSDVYGVALSVDSLALYINQTIMNETIESINASNKISSDLLPEEINSLKKIISQGPQDWTELVKIIPYITVKEGDSISRSAVAMGLGENIEQSANIISTIMLQNGTQIVTTDRKSADFQNAQGGTTESAYPGRGAIQFYTGFAENNKSVYTWNEDFSTSAKQAFLDNKLAMTFDDSTFYSTLKSSDIDFSFTIVPMPQLSDDPTSYATYWTETVTNNSKNADVAWDFLAFASSATNVQSYISNTKKPTSLLSRVDAYNQSSTGLSVFNMQAGVAQSWYKGPDPSGTNQIFKNWADNIVLSGKSVAEATNTAASQLTTLLQQTDPPPLPDTSGTATEETETNTNTSATNEAT